MSCAKTQEDKSKRYSCNLFFLKAYFKLHMFIAFRTPALKLENFLVNLSYFRNLSRNSTLVHKHKQSNDIIFSFYLLWLIWYDIYDVYIIILQRLFASLDTGCNGCIFIQMHKRTGDPGPVEIVQSMMSSAASTRKHMSRLLISLTF